MSDPMSAEWKKAACKLCADGVPLDAETSRFHVITSRFDDYDVNIESTRFQSCTATSGDEMRLKFLEAFVAQRGPLVLHNGFAELGRFPGLGFRPGFRALTEAIDCLMRGSPELCKEITEEKANDGR